MIQQLGSFSTTATVRFMWNTNAGDGSAITRGTNGTIRIYKDNGTTERASSNGITDSEDFDSLTGVHQCSIDLTDNSDPGFYTTSHEYFVVIAGAVIDSKTVNACLAQFSIIAGSSSPSAEEIANAVWDEALAEHDTEDSIGNILNDMVEESSGIYRFTSGALAQAPTPGTLAAIADAIWDEVVSGHTSSTTFGKYLGGAPSGVSLAADIAVIDAVTDKINTAMELDGGIYRFTANALEQGPIGEVVVADIADAVWDELLTGHTTEDSAGKVLGDLGTINAGDIADAVWEEVLSGHTGISGSAAEALDDAYKGTPPSASDIAVQVWAVLPSGSIVADGSNNNVSFKTDRTETDTDFWKSAFITFTSGDLIGQTRQIYAYNGTTKFITVSTDLSDTPQAGDDFILINR